jgi:preprotein translocase subunit SecG
LEVVLYVIFFLSCLVLIAAVLLQPGKTDAGALFTSNVSSSAFAPRGTATVLSKVTITAATVFMLSALFLAMPAVTGNVSVLGSNPETPAGTTDANTNTAANTATDTSNSNGALIETPATEQIANQVANAQAANSTPANASVANSAGSANKPAANANKAVANKPAKK